MKLPDKKMAPIDLTGLSKYEQEWVALDRSGQVLGHASRLSDLRKGLASSAEAARYFFVPSSKLGFAGFCRR